MNAIGEAHRLLLEAEALLFERFDATSDPAEKRALRAQIEAMGRLKDRALLDDAAARAARLNALSDLLAEAIANLRTQPFNGIAGRIEALLAGIGEALGAGAAEARGAPATEEPAVAPAAPAPAPAPAPATPPRAAARGAPAAPPADPRDREYAELFESCAIRPERAAIVARMAARLAAQAAVYRDAAEAAGGAIPWYFVGLLHAMESSFSFSAHLHNGDPLTARTVQVPAGHPKSGTPPFTWKESAVDALRHKGLDRVTDWSLPRMLGMLERFNGFGYRNRGVRSPYLWSFSQHYERGKFVRDRVFDPDAVSQQVGAAVLLKQLVLDGVVTLDAKAGTMQAEAALGLSAAALAAPALQPAAGTLPAPAALPAKFLRDELVFPGEVREGTRNEGAAKRVQEWLSFHGFPTRVDSDFRSGTADALRAFQTAQGLPSTGVADAASWAALTAPMLRALATPDPAPATLHAMVLAVARQHLAQKPIEIGGDNLGPWVRLYMTGRDGPKQFWCAGFACLVLEQAARALGQRMPIPRQVGVDALVADAQRDGRFVAGADLATPAARTSRLPPGSLFVIRHKSNPRDWIHTGIVTEAREGSYLTIEGNADRDGGANGFEVTARSRGYGMADFVLIA